MVFAVHGVYLKYVAASMAFAFAAHRSGGGWLWWVLANFALANFVIAILFQLKVGMSLIGKDQKQGTIPLWSYLVWVGFHVPTWLYTALHTWTGKQTGVPVATEVLPGWFLGGRYGDELGRQWAGTVDLTCEFPERCMATTQQYLLIRCWDGVPPTPEQLEQAAQFCAKACRQGDVMVHCAHGRGRSTTVMCAALVRAGVCDDWEAAFEACKAKRPVVRLNSKMRRALTEWTDQYNQANSTKRD